MTTCYTGTTAIQNAANSAGGGGTVNVGSGTFGPVSLTDGITLLGSGHDTIITGVVNEATNTSLIYAYANAPNGFAHPLRIQSVNLAATAAPGTRGNEITLKDGNRTSLDTITNVWFTVASGSQGSVRGLYSYNSYAPLVLTRNTFSKTQYGALLETGGGDGSVYFGQASITYNLFDHLMRAPAPLGFVTAIQVSIDNPGPTMAGAQDYSRNNFVFDDKQGTTALEVNGHGSPSNNGLPTTIGFHNDNLDHADAVLNETEGMLSATDTWWGCPTGPDVNPAMGTGSNACTDLGADPAVTFWTPWLTSKASLPTGASG